MVQEYEHHIPVMLQEVLEYLNPKRGDIIVDGTLGFAGHSKAILEKITPGGKLVGLDQDKEALAIAKKNLTEYAADTDLVNKNFVEIDEVLKSGGIKQVSGIVLDLGISSYQIDRPERGFSVRHDGPLDMRMNAEADLKASDIVNTYSEKDIAEILKEYGEERFSFRVARFIVEERKKKLIETTSQLSQIVMRALGARGKTQKIHPATRTFQGLRIAVNDELNKLSLTIDKAVTLLKPGGRLVIISFHSLEDRIVKTKFRDFAKDKKIHLLTKKPVYPTDQELAVNPRARSAKMRAAERI